MPLRSPTKGSDETSIRSRSKASRNSSNAVSARSSNKAGAEKSSKAGAEESNKGSVEDDSGDNDQGSEIENLATDRTSRISSDERLDDLFPEDPNVTEASRRIRRILYRRRLQETAGWSSIRKYLHATFYDPSSMRARLYMGFSTAVVLLFLIVFMIDTFPQYRVRQHWRTIADTVNLTTAAFFGLEWVLRFYTYRRPLLYVFQPMSIVDLLGVIPGFINYNVDTTHSFGKVKWLRALQVLRILRLLRLTEYSIELYVTVRSLKKSLPQILVVMMVIISLLLTACFLLFFAENDSLDGATMQWMRKNHGVLEVSPFQNVFFCLYWGFVTITTVGYGDYTPVSPWGQVIACATMMVGVFTIVFPTSIISNNFAAEWEAFNTAQKMNEQRILQRQYQRKKQGLATTWDYANRNYGDEEGINQLQYDNNTDNQAGKYPVSTQVHYEAGPQHRPRSLTSLESMKNDEGPVMPDTDKIAPFEYGRIIDVSKRVERDLGIPGISLGDFDSNNEVNRNLVVSAMYSKLYNDAFTSLCERMLARLMEQNGLVSTEQITEFLKQRPSSRNAFRSWPQEKNLTILEHKLLSFMFDHICGNLKKEYRENPDTAASIQQHRCQRRSKENTEAQADTQSDNQPETCSLPCSNPPSTRRKRGLRQRLRSKLTRVYDHSPLSRETSQQPLYDYVESSSRGRRSRHSIPQFQMLPRRVQELNNLNMAENQHSSLTTELALDTQSEDARGSVYSRQRPSSASTSAMVIDVPPSEPEESS
ncbi:hypothetical protein GGI25_006358 [Coemansia spiralis]|uniref:Ion transport domain-containing protein n=2 Tax=Coemansia TaxID=4863 RepID=A0A9W8KVK4_9FUNG|nr:hypothetical protein EDC05_006321 [Coemansia umbellata]KAJ2618543.1 hypothetical protein GGI26_006510 [Coemansia sp. RSA 1358]KAJ2668762.1 hypothetical protein GGI25_006358 [Coemansia spiralis]